MIMKKEIIKVVFKIVLYAVTSIAAVFGYNSL